MLPRLLRTRKWPVSRIITSLTRCKERVLVLLSFPIIRERAVELLKLCFAVPLLFSEPISRWSLSTVYLCKTVWVRRRPIIWYSAADVAAMTSCRRSTPKISITWRFWKARMPQLFTVAQPITVWSLSRPNRVLRVLSRWMCRAPRRSRR